MLTVTLLAFALAAEPSPFKFTSKVEEDRVTAKTEKDRTLIDITSPTGISEPVIERTGEAWPENIVIRLHTSGLEQFRAKSDKLTISAFVASHTDYSAHLSVSKKNEDPKDPKSAYYLDFKMIGKDGKPATTIPLKNGYFEMKLPKPFFEGNPKSVKLTWIDFFRR